MVLRDLRRRRYILYIPLFGRRLRFSFLEFLFYNIFIVGIIFFAIALRGGGNSVLGDIHG